MPTSNEAIHAQLIPQLGPTPFQFHSSAVQYMSAYPLDACIPIGCLYTHWMLVSPLDACIPIGCLYTSRLVLGWQQVGARLVLGWQQVGTRLVLGWYQVGTRKSVLRNLNIFGFCWDMILDVFSEILMDFQGFWLGICTKNVIRT